MAEKKAVSMLVLAAKTDEQIVLRDKVSGTQTAISFFRRGSGGLQVVFDAPSQVKISRERRNAKDGNTRPD